MNAASQTASVSSAADFSPSVRAPRVATFPNIQVVTVSSESTSGIAPVLTFVLWSACLLVGVLGFVLPYSRPRAPALPPEPVVVEKLAVDLVNDPLPPAALPSDPLSTPPPPAALVQPQIAQAVAVAEPSAVAFALPVEGPTITVAADQATHARPAIVATSAVAGSLAPQTLVFGQGEGRQPAPEYPARSVKLGQEGTVDIRLTVDTNGQVTDTAVAAPCAWPLLNDAAERTVRHRWRFARGSVRVYEVAIRFALAK
jgi:protein TonB